MSFRLSAAACVGALLGVCPPLAAQGAAAAAAFVPLVSFTDTVAKCEEMTPAVLRPGERGWLLRFTAHDSVARVVSAVWDSTARLNRYSDARGDLRGPPVPVAQRGPRTTVAIDVSTGMALLLNESHGQSHGSTMTTVNAALAAEQLGPPRRLLARLHTQCGAPAEATPP